MSDETPVDLPALVIAAQAGEADAMPEDKLHFIGGMVRAIHR